MPLFGPNTVVLQPIFYMFTRCMLCIEKSIETMENENYGKINENFG